jgi:hypothetical protein
LNLLHESVRETVRAERLANRLYLFKNYLVFFSFRSSKFKVNERHALGRVISDLQRSCPISICPGIKFEGLKLDCNIIIDWMQTRMNLTIPTGRRLAWGRSSVNEAASAHLIVGWLHVRFGLLPS